MAFRKAGNDVLENGFLIWRQRVQAFHGQRMQRPDVVVHHPYRPEVHGVMQRHHVGDDGSDEALTMGLVVELTGNLGTRGPLVWTKNDSL